MQSAKSCEKLLIGQLSRFLQKINYKKKGHSVDQQRLKGQIQWLQQVGLVWKFLNPCGGKHRNIYETKIVSEIKDLFIVQMWS